MRLRTAALIAAVAAAAVAGCGGLSHDEYESQLNDALARVDAGVVPTTDDGSSFDDSADTFNAAAKEVAAIEPPDDLASTHEQLVEGLRGASEAAKRLQRAEQLMQDDPKAAEKLIREGAGDNSFRQIVSAITDLQDEGIDVELSE